MKIMCQYSEDASERTPFKRKRKIHVRKASYPRAVRSSVRGAASLGDLMPDVSRQLHVLRDRNVS
jgi:hypothetical protein